ncbi:MAG: hypothetical protein COV45_01310 [Deltaproteobacteria bacterium CG11_big_fil_rev_8_21_14_0_20_47_16]|nr:MAG: hypothetical protein COV45_01310 [Deltaproteobacteria bacterium CG11_big_fil_rev_8_21_14_0_20_47_16]
MKRITYVIMFVTAILVAPRLLCAQEVRSIYQDLPKSFFENPQPNDSVWKAVPATMVSLLPQNITAPGLQSPSVETANVKSIHNGKWMAVQLSWADASRDVNVDTSKATDACAIQFPIKGGDKTSPFMGATDAPVAITHWKGIWQNDVLGKYQDVPDLHPNVWVGMYLFATGKRPFPVTTSFNTVAARNTLGSIYVNNPIAQLHRAIPVEELMAEGFGTLTTQPHQDARGNGVWDKGTWTVVFARPLSTGDKHDPKLVVGGETVIAFAVWDGGHKDVGGRKNYAPWVPIKLEKIP